MIRRTLLLLLPAALLSAAYADDVPAKPGPADAAALTKLLTTAAAWDARGKKEFDEAVRKDLDRQVAAIADPSLRERAGKLLPDLERAALLHARVQQVLADIKDVKGEAKTEPGGPAWLRDAVGRSRTRGCSTSLS